MLFRSKNLTQDAPKKVLGFDIYPKIWLKKSAAGTLQFEIKAATLHETVAARVCISGKNLVFSPDTDQEVSGNRIAPADSSLKYTVRRVSADKIHLSDNLPSDNMKHVNGDYTVGTAK